MAELGDREMILANFQAVTGIDNLDECISLLDNHDWDLMSCVNAVFANRSAEQLEVEDSVGESLTTRSVKLQTHLPVATLTHSSGNQNSASGSSAERVLQFNVEWRDKTIPVSLPESSSVATLKKELEIQIGVPTALQTLTQWPKDISVIDRTILSTLKLEDETSLVLLTQSTTNSFAGSSSQCLSTVNNGLIKSSQAASVPDVKLRIRYTNKRHELSFPGTKTIGEVKTDVSDLTHVEPRHQEWTGWPEEANDQTKLSDLNKPFHLLTLRRRPSPRNRSPPKVKPVIHVESDDDEEAMDICDSNGSTSSGNSVEIEVDDDDDDDDLILTEVPIRKRIKELMPPHSKDTQETLTTFVSNFEERYGHCHPHFYIGSFNEALEEANAKTAKDRWPLLLYLHHDSSILTNVFCSQTLCVENVVSYISENFISWAWDMSHDTNRTLLYDIITQKCGSGAADTVRGFRAEQYPLVVVIMKNRSSLEVSAVLQGHSTMNEVMTTLLNAHEVFEESRSIDIREEIEREARELVKREQDEAYQESLRADQAKAEERERQESEALRVKKETEEKAFLDAQTKQAQINSLEDQLPDEPGPDCLEPISILRFRMPNSEPITRRFLANSPLKVVLIFVQSKGYLEDQYTVVTNFPRKQLSNMDPRQSLQSLGLYPQETLFVEEI
ncbi:FAS-associated factor 1-like [Dendronephthya gigantea]|uniref:FAS-associated factor 1-like n=1 Tax=Dendronephthya gigantea TaxID=151771 RepID=UPI00106A067C|nr:FAS-associated factor 1-like [Dendronephthya gigantea]